MNKTHIHMKMCYKHTHTRTNKLAHRRRKEASYPISRSQLSSNVEWHSCQQSCCLSVLQAAAITSPSLFLSLSLSLPSAYLSVSLIHSAFLYHSHSFFLSLSLFAFSVNPFIQKTTPLLHKKEGHKTHQTNSSQFPH